MGRGLLYHGQQHHGLYPEARKKIEPNPDAPEYILTIWGIGYKFNDKL